MAPSQQNPARPRLGNVLSRRTWEDRRSNSTTSSVNSHGSIGESTHGSFDPENEALVSTGPINFSPANRPHPLKGSQSGPTNNSYQIDMKAARAAFSEEAESGSDAGDFSIEVGRGGKQDQRTLEDSRNDDSLHSSEAMIGDYKVMYSPPRSAGRHPSNIVNNDRARSLRQDAQVRLASNVSQKENHDPAPRPFRSFKSSDQSTKIKRKTLGEINARASEIQDAIFLNDDRPIHAAQATKTTRFSRSKRNVSNQGTLTDTNAAADMANNNQSYILPDLPNLSQLMSGTIQTRTPGRMYSAAHPAFSQTPREAAHKLIDTVPVPDDEKAIFVSLNLLQGKVNRLEAATMEFQQTIDELKTRNLVLKAEKRDLKAENERLRTENAELRTGQGQDRHSRQQEAQNQERVSSQDKRNKSLSAQVDKEIWEISKERQEEDMFSLTPTESVKCRPVSAPSRYSNNATQKQDAATQQDAAASSSRNAKKVVIKENEARADSCEGRKMAREQTATRDATYLSTQPVANFLSDLRNMLEIERGDAKQRKSGKESHEAGSKLARQKLETTVASQIAYEALPRKSSMKDVSQRLHLSDSAPATLNHDQSEKVTTFRNGYDEEVSEDVTDQVSRPLSQAARRNSDPTATAASNTSRRRHRTTDYDEDNMTSAFIIPDITIAQPTATGTAAAVPATSTDIHLTDAAQHVIHSINPHDASNCIVCSRLTLPNHNSNSNPAESAKPTIHIPKPTPVSHTPVTATEENPDPTLRPSQPPAVALATVLKELNDQHVHLKARLAAAQAKYQQTDPRLSRRMRERLCGEIARLQRRCEMGADMIYRLYDVLEGQRLGGGGEMDREEVEVTINGLREIVGGESEDEVEGGEETG